MIKRKEIAHIADIQLLVNSFYTTIRENALLGPIFDGVIGDRWPAHLEKMYRFWQTVLLEEHTYDGRPFPPHADLPVDREHFDTWVSIWHETIDQHFEGATAEEAKWRGVKMAGMFLSKMEYYKTTPGRPLI